MATFLVEIQIANPSGQHWTTLQALANTNASTTSVPASILRDLGVTPQRQNNFRSTQGEIRTMDIGQTYIRIMDEEFITDFIFNDEATIPLLGALTLESAHLIIDPREKQLIPSDGLLM